MDDVESLNDIEQMTSKDVLSILYMVCGSKGKVGVELGCCTGRMTCELQQHVEHLTAIDNFSLSNNAHIREVLTEPKRLLLARVAQFSNVRVIDGDSSESAKLFEDGSVDWVFIDAGHRYSEVIKDLNAWIPKVKMGGILIGHDFEGWAYNPKLVEEDEVDGIHHGVIKAVGEKFVQVNWLPDRVWFAFRAWVKEEK